VDIKLDFWIEICTHKHHQLLLCYTFGRANEGRASAGDSLRAKALL